MTCLFLSTDFDLQTLDPGDLGRRCDPIRVGGRGWSLSGPSPPAGLATPSFFRQPFDTLTERLRRAPITTDLWRVNPLIHNATFVSRRDASPQRLSHLLRN
jgi:hypothetical protein